MNKVILKGRLARDVELRTTPTGKSVATVSIAVNRRGKDQSADFIPLVIWEARAEAFARYLFKGSEVLVEGHMQVRNYDDKNGNKRYVTEVIVDDFEFCGSKSDNANRAQSGGYGNAGSGGFSGSSDGFSSDAGGSSPFGTSESFGKMSDDEDIPF